MNNFKEVFSHVKKTNVQATVDHERRITSYELGWLGSVTDVKMFKQSKIWRNRHSLFKNGHYLFADKGMFDSIHYLTSEIDLI